MTTTDLGPYLEWLEAHMNAARAVSPDALLTAVAVAALLIVLLFVAWWRAARRARSARQMVARLEGDLGAARSSLEDEVKWRIGAEKFAAQPKRPAGH
jgi:hypothetical protein